jgi:hypothetical protein
LADGGLEGNNGDFGILGGSRSGGGGRCLAKGTQGKTRGQSKKTNKRTLHCAEKLLRRFLF